MPKVELLSSAAAATGRQALRIVLGSLGATLIAAGLCLLAWGPAQARWALIGGGIELAGTAYLAIAMLKQSASLSRSILGGPFLTWGVKTILTISLLVLAFRSKAVMPLPLLAGLFGSLLGYWLSMVFVRVNYANGAHGE